MFDVPIINKKEIKESTLLEDNYDSVLLSNIEKIVKELFPNNYNKINYCGWLFPNGVVLDTGSSTNHYWYENKVKEILEVSDEHFFITSGITRFNIYEGLIELGHNVIPTDKQLKVLKEVLIKYYGDSKFTFGGGGAFLFADAQGNAHYINKYVFDDEPPYDPLYKRDGEDIYKIIENYCRTGRVRENLKEDNNNDKNSI